VVFRKIETHAVVRRIILARGKMPERAVHPEMHRQPAPRFEADKKMLAVPP
jgi:hypothetical protein